MTPPRLDATVLGGGLAMVVTVLIWSGFALSLRALGTSPVTVGDVAMVRFGLPLLLLAPFLPSRWAGLRRVRPLDLGMIVLGAGPAYLLTAAAGAAATSALHVGAIVAGAAPLAAAFLLRCLERRTLSPAALAAYVALIAGVCLLLSTSGVSPWGGAAELLAAAALWGVYTVGLKRAGLDPVGGAIALCGPSLAILLCLHLSGALPLRLAAWSAPQALPLLALQGLGVGLLGGLAYGQAIRSLGAPLSAAIGALSPALTAVLAVVLLHEPLSASMMAGVVLICFGVFAAARSNPLGGSYR